MTSTRGLLISASLLPALFAPTMLLTAGSAAASTGPALLRASQLGTGYKGAPTATEKAAALDKGCKGLKVGPTDPLSSKTFVKELSGTSEDVVQEIVLSTPNAVEGMAAFDTLKSSLKNCVSEVNTAIKGKGKFTVTKATAPVVSDADESFALKTKISVKATDNGETAISSGIGQQNVYLTGRYVVFVSGAFISAKEDKITSTLTLSLGYGPGTQKLTAKAARAALHTL